MASGIQKFDIGYCGNISSTWHGLPQYKCIPDRNITIMELLEVADYPLEKQQLARPDGTVVDAWSIVRTDNNVTLVPAVGNKFTLINNKVMVNTINENLLSLFPDVHIDSCGTLFNGASFFISLNISEFQVKGDKSPTLTTLLYCNPLGKGSYISGVASQRVVCANTLRVAEAQAAANQSLKKFRHTASATQKINDHLIDMAEVKLGLKRHEEKLNFLAGEAVDTTQVETFLNQLFTVPEKDGRGKTIAINNRSNFMEIFEGTQRMTLDNPNTKYSLLQASTDLYDHKMSTRNGDEASVLYDGLMGIRADKKQKALDLIMQL